MKKKLTFFLLFLPLQFTLTFFWGHCSQLVSIKKHIDRSSLFLSNYYYCLRKSFDKDCQFWSWWEFRRRKRPIDQGSIKSLTAIPFECLFKVTASTGSRFLLVHVYWLHFKDLLIWWFTEGIWIVKYGTPLNVTYCWKTYKKKMFTDFSRSCVIPVYELDTK